MNNSKIQTLVNSAVCTFNAKVDDIKRERLDRAASENANAEMCQRQTYVAKNIYNIMEAVVTELGGSITVLRDVEQDFLEPSTVCVANLSTHKGVSGFACMTLRVCATTAPAQDDCVITTIETVSDLNTRSKSVFTTDAYGPFLAKTIANAFAQSRR